MRMTQLAVIVAVLGMGSWTFAQAQQEKDQQAQKAEQKAQQAQDQAREAQEKAQQDQATLREHQQQGSVSGSTGSMSGSQAGMGGSQGGMEQVIAPGLLLSPNDMQIQGKILSHKDIDITNDKNHRVLRVQTKNGQMMDVDLGRKDRLPDGLNINDGQWVIVTGVQGQLENRNVLVAHNMANVFNFGAEGSTPGGRAPWSTGNESGRDIKRDFNNSNKDNTNTRDTTKDSTGY